MNGMITKMERTPAKREALEDALVPVAAALCAWSIFLQGVSLLTKLNMESTIFAGVGSEHFSNSATIQAWRLAISLCNIYRINNLIHGNFFINEHFQEIKEMSKDIFIKNIQMADLVHVLPAFFGIEIQ